MPISSQSYGDFERRASAAGELPHYPEHVCLLSTLCMIVTHHLHESLHMLMDNLRWMDGSSYVKRKYNLIQNSSFYMSERDKNQSFLSKA